MYISSACFFIFPCPEKRKAEKDSIIDAERRDWNVQNKNDKDKLDCMTLLETRDGVVFYVFDTETTGLDPDNDHVVQFSAIRYVVQNKQPVPEAELDIYIKLPFPMPEKAMAVHHITDEFLADKPVTEEAIGEIIDFWGEKPIVVGFNTDFDVAMMHAMYRRCNMHFTPYFSLDVLEMMRDVSTDFEKYKLEDLIKEYGLDQGLTFHSAIDDVRATGMLLQLAHNYYVENPLPENREKPYVNRFWFWKGFNKNQS